MTTFAVAYHGGTYGTYMSWIISRLIDSNTILDPFTELGQSHRFVCPRQDLEKICDYNGSSPVVRTHPKTLSDHDLSLRMDWLSSCLPTVYVYPDPAHKLLCINNFYYKIWPDWWNTHGNLSVLHESWPETRDLDVDQIPNWVRREYLSYYLVPAWESLVEWYHLDRWSNTKCLVVHVGDLIKKLPSTIQRFLCWSGINPVIDPRILEISHKKNLYLQRYLCQDEICSEVLHSVINGYHHVWDPLPLASEAWLQSELRQNGLGLRCYGLDIMPCNSLHLRELLYPLT